MNIAPALLNEVIAHALEEPENEVCGVVAAESGESLGGNGRPGQAVRVYRARNVHKSPLKFEIDPQELLELWEACQQDGGELGAIYHSHVRSSPYPSQTDVNFAANWPGVEWIIVGLARGGEPEVRSYLIEGGDIQEVAIPETAM
jgi:[CysO sulfur-carrier protein]-S-L-cysteine hydrolase